MLNVGVIASGEIKSNIAQVAGNNYVPPAPTYSVAYAPPATTIPPISNVTSSSLLGFSSASWDASPIPGALYNVTITNSDGSVTSYTTDNTNAFAVVATPGGTVNYQVSVVAPVNGLATYSPITNVSVGSYNYGGSFLGGF